MGAWGVGSDENDTTYDILGMSIGARVSTRTPTKQERKEIKKDFKKLSTRDTTPGVVLWCLKQRIMLPVSVLKKTIRTLEKENVEEEGWFQPSMRRKAIRKEMKILKKVIDTGKIQRLKKVKGIFG
jgi:hypothetical protein